MALRYDGPQEAEDDKIVSQRLMEERSKDYSNNKRVANDWVLHTKVSRVQMNPR